ncbi:hypothetical protein NDU88_005485 [Pleurodeles waltl]|uniref:Uncharacterized protein n=1 Tax=Pleurodeles waltl TaxID=8319 RepID=A0AAV7UIY6_PLEWA|nr:hypothetical protein NDU88_005485 [Pleurodeles waltl]
MLTAPALLQRCSGPTVDQVLSLSRCRWSPGQSNAALHSQSPSHPSVRGINTGVPKARPLNRGPAGPGPYQGSSTSSLPQLLLLAGARSTPAPHLQVCATPWAPPPLSVRACWSQDALSIHPLSPGRCRPSPQLSTGKAPHSPSSAPPGPQGTSHSTPRSLVRFTRDAAPATGTPYLQLPQAQALSVCGLYPCRPMPSRPPLAPTSCALSLSAGLSTPPEVWGLQLPHRRLPGFLGLPLLPPAAGLGIPPLPAVPQQSPLAPPAHRSAPGPSLKGFKRP